MAGKNHRRYKIRKRNSIKHIPEPLFDTPPVLISTWEELSKLENEKYRIEVDLKYGCGWVRPKFKLENDDEYFKHNFYLSTHTFYGDDYSEYTRILRDFGFNIQLANWDGKTVYCQY